MILFVLAPSFGLIRHANVGWRTFDQATLISELKDMFAQNFTDAQRREFGEVQNARDFCKELAWVMILLEFLRKSPRGIFEISILTTRQSVFSV